MKILQIHNRYRQPGGEDAVVEAEADLLRRAGHDVVQLEVANPEGFVRTGATLVVAPWNPLSARRVRATVEDVRPDVAHVHNTWYSLSSSVLRALADVPLAMTLHNYRFTCANAQLYREGSPCELCIGSHTRHAIRYRCYRGSVVASALAAGSISLNRRLGTWNAHVDAFLALTEFARGTFVGAGLSEEKVRIKANFTQDPGPRAAAPSASHMVLFVGRISPEKGLDVALDAWERAQPTGLDLVVVGDGPERSALEARGVPGVSFLGRLGAEAVRELMQESRVLLFPSRWYEGQPIVMLEAFASGLPVAASRLGAMAEMLDGQDEWLVEPGSADAWTEVLERLDDQTVDTAGKHVRARYEAAYTPAGSLAVLEEVYEAITAQG